MIFWYVLIGVLVLLLTASAVYLLTRFHRFRFVRRIGERHKILSWLLCLIPLGLVGCFGFINLFTLIVVGLHLALFFLLMDLLCRSWRKKDRPYYAGILAIVCCAVYLGVGWYNAHHVRETRYDLTTEKPLGEDLTIVEIADSHLGITLDGQAFGEQMQRVQEADPDLVVIVGDFVDDDTRKTDMLEACKALGELKTRYGVYFVYGNHDKGYYRYRDFTSAELREALTEAHVTILEDASVLVDDRFYVTGRQDRTVANRASTSDLTRDLHPDHYIIMLDHQPNDYANEAASGADLVLSGHTHGGHIFPAGLIGRLMGANDRTYGLEQRDRTAFIVTSGISGWAIPFKTGTFSEYVVIHVEER